MHPPNCDDIIMTNFYGKNAVPPPSPLSLHLPIPIFDYLQSPIMSLQLPILDDPP